MFQGHRLRKSANAAKDVQAISMATRNNHAFLQSLIDHLPVLVYARDMRPENPAGRMIVRNKTAEVVTGYPIDAVLSKINRAVFPQPIVDMFEEFEQKMRDNLMVLGITPRTASKPTLALNSAVCTLRFFRSVILPSSFQGRLYMSAPLTKMSVGMVKTYK